MNDLLKSVKETVIDRVRNPFFFCFILSWLYFNWQSVLIVTLSKKPIEERIAVLAGKLDPWHLNSLILPAISAFIIAVAFPYLGVAIRRLHMQYENISEGFVRKQKTRAYETISHVAQSKVQSDNAEELAKAEIATKLADEEESQLKSKLNMDALSTHHETLSLSIETLEKQIKSANETISTLSEKSISLQNEINESENILVGLKGKIKESNRKEGQSTTKQRNTTVAETLGLPAYKTSESSVAHLATNAINTQLLKLYNPASDLPNNLKDIIKAGKSSIGLGIGEYQKNLLEGMHIGKALSADNWRIGKAISAIPPMINSLKYIDPTKNPEDSDLPAKDDT
ncbi:hypothetical protein [Yersinia mollaretii]|uniref:hypothetical protein n=1 Tax=Yersinia mollaretii TaxID=33060 RepID=UPI0011A2CE97|nr:hypothetical protein [Yersinia mollaretii]